VLYSPIFFTFFSSRIIFNMLYTSAAVALLAGSATAYPGMTGSRRAVMEDMIKQAELEKREPTPVAQPEASPVAGLLDPISSLLGTVTGGLDQIIQGISGSVAEGILNPSDKRPEPGYEFIAPGPNDSRGPCPGLNLLGI